MRNIGIIAQKHFYAYKGIDSSLVYTNADVEDFRDGVYLGYHISLVALIPVLMQAIAGIMPSGSMTAQIKVQGLNGYQYNATVEISGSAGGVSAGDIGAGLLIQQVTGSGSAKDNDKGDSNSNIPVKDKTKASNGLDYQSNPKHTPGQPGNRPNAGIEPKNSGSYLKWIRNNGTGTSHGYPMP
jgi:hypothetical protein